MTKSPSRSRFRPLAAAADAAYVAYRADPAAEPTLWLALSKMAANLAESHFKGPAEDAAQEGLVELLKALKRGLYVPRKEARFSTWVARVLRRAFKTHAYAQKSRCVSLEDLPPAVFQRLAAHDPHEGKTLIEDAISKLPDQMQTVVRMRLAGESFNSIAAQLTIEVSTAKWHWQTAIKKLQA